MDQPIAEVLRARRIELVDDDDVVRAVLHFSEPSEDGVYVELFNPKRSRSLVLSADAQGVGASLWHRGNMAASVYMDPDGFVSARSHL